GTTTAMRRPRNIGMEAARPAAQNGSIRSVFFCVFFSPPLLELLRRRPLDSDDLRGGAALTVGGFAGTGVGVGGGAGVGGVGEGGSASPVGFTTAGAGGVSSGLGSTFTLPLPPATGL